MLLIHWCGVCQTFKTWNKLVMGYALIEIWILLNISAFQIWSSNWRLRISPPRTCGTVRELHAKHISKNLKQKHSTWTGHQPHTLYGSAAWRPSQAREIVCRAHFRRECGTAELCPVSFPFPILEHKDWENFPGCFEGTRTPKQSKFSEEMEPKKWAINELNNRLIA